MIKPKQNIKDKRISRMVLSILAIFFVLVVIFIIKSNIPEEQQVYSFQECSEEGYLIEESYPRRCRTLEGMVFTEELTIKESCTSFGGIFLEEYNECGYISEEQCSFLNGSFNECVSACRHDPNTPICIQVCVPLCSFNA